MHFPALHTLQDTLQSVNTISIVFRIFLAMLMGGMLGFERERKNRPAGFRTYMLVCLGSALVMLTNQYMYQQFPEVKLDPGRLGAQVISGIGFLGAGTIIVTKRNQIKGLTTAAGLWTSACLGLAIGIGFYGGAIFGGAAIMTAMVFLHKVDQRIRINGKYMNLYVEFKNTKCISTFMEYLQDNSMEVYDMMINKGQIPGTDHIAIVLTVRMQIRTSHAYILQMLSQANGVQYIGEI